MITEKDVEQYLDKPVRVELNNGSTFDGVYWDWQLGVSFDVPDAMILKSLDEKVPHGERVLIEAAKIAAVKPLDA